MSRNLIPCPERALAAAAGSTPLRYDVGVIAPLFESSEAGASQRRPAPKRPGKSAQKALWEAGR